MEYLENDSLDKNGQQIAISTSLKSSISKSKDQQKQLVNELFANLVIAHDLPFNLCENKLFLQFLELTKTHPAIQSRDLLASINRQHQELLSNLYRMLEETCKTIALQVDISDSSTGHSILAIQGTWLTSDFMVRTELLYLNRINSTYDAESIAGLIHETLEKFHLCEKLISISGVLGKYDRQACCNYLESLLSEWEGVSGTPTRFLSSNWVHSCANVVNLVNQTVLRTINKKATQQAKTIIEISKNSAALVIPEDVDDITLLRTLALWICDNSQSTDHQNSFSLDNSLIDFSNMCSSINIMVSRALDVRHELSKLVQACSKLQKIKLDDEYWHRLQRTKSFFYTFDKIYQNIVSEESSINVVLHYYNYLSFELQEIPKFKDPKNQIFKEAAEMGWKVLRKYCTLAKDSDLYLIASVLDPSTRTDEITRDPILGLVTIGLMRDSLKSDYKSVPFNITSRKRMSLGSERTDCEGSKYRRLDSGEKVPSSEKGYNDIDMYLFSHSSLSSYRQRMSYQGIRDWWRRHQTRHPEMSVIAREYLCIPCSAVEVKSIFRSGRQAIGTRRGSLAPEDLNALMMITAYKDKYGNCGEDDDEGDDSDDDDC